MNKKLKIVLFLLATIVIGGIVVWKYVNKASDDFATQKPTKTFSFNQLIDKTVNDTASLHLLKDDLVAINGNIKKITKDSNSVTIELGDTDSMSSIICQFDQRHLNDLTSLTEGSPISVKGKISGFAIDTELGLGNTVEMNYCSLNK